MADAQNTTDVMTRRIRVVSGVRFRPVLERGQWKYQLEAGDDQHFFRIGLAEYGLISFLRGRNTLATACGLAAAKMGPRSISADRAIEIVGWLVQNDLAEFVDEAMDDGDVAKSSRTFATKSDRTYATRANAKQASGSMWQTLNPFWLKIPLCRNAAAIKLVSLILVPLFSKLGLLSTIGLGMLATIVGITKADVLTQHHMDLQDPTQWIWLLGIWLGLKGLHEMGHAAACHRMGASVREAGVVMILLSPLAYVDLTNSWRLTRRRDRIIISLAGIYIEFVAAALAIIVAAMADSAQTILLCQQVIIAASVTTLVFNANPLMRFDGYHVLADAIDVPNLYGLASQHVKNMGRRLFLGQCGPRSSLIGWRSVLVVVYAWLAFAWRLLIGCSLLIAAAWLLAGAGIAIAMLGCIQWYARPILRSIASLYEASRVDRGRLMRPIGILGLCGGVGFMVLFVMPFPTHLAAPAVVRYPADCLVRFQVDGFVARVHVSGGRRVAQGDLLVELENDQLRTDLLKTNLEIQACELRQLAAIDTLDAAAEQIEAEKLKSLIARQGFLKDQVALLKVTAHRSGRIEANHLDEVTGRFVRRGDRFTQIVTDDRKEIVSMIDQASIREVRNHENRPIQFAAAGICAFESVPTLIQPRATDRLPAESLAATSGGPMAVRRADDKGGDGDPVQLLDPHFQAITEVEPRIATRIPAGTVLQSRWGYRTSPIGARIKVAMERLWYDGR